MISYSRDTQEAIPSSAVKIIGLGGAGANMLERIALDSIEGAELLALNTDIRTLNASLAREKIQLGLNLTKGLGTGGDPHLGQQAVLEAEAEIRSALKGQRIVFLCAGLGGGTGSGAAPIVSRIAREEGAFVVVFATMPFHFEGLRRREQADTSLNQLAVLSNALVTFDNNRMGELVLAKQGIHEAFSAADKMISESIKAVIRLVVRPGLINIGLDDLMSALRTTRSRCLFGSGMADGKDRASKALRNAFASPLLDQGSLLKEAKTVLVHLSGGESLTLFEIELLMRNLQKHVPGDAHVLFGAAIDPIMGDNLSITLISALPEDSLTGTPPEKEKAQSPPASSPDTVIENPFSEIDRPKPAAPEIRAEIKPELPEPEPANQPSAEENGDVEEADLDAADDGEDEDDEEEIWDIAGDRATPSSIQIPVSKSPPASISVFTSSSSPGKPDEISPEKNPDGNQDGEKDAEFPQPPLRDEEPEERPFAEFVSPAESSPSKSPGPQNPFVAAKDPEPIISPREIKSKAKSLWGSSKFASSPAPEKVEEDPFNDPELSSEESPSSPPELTLGKNVGGSQSELSFNNTPKGRFEGENPNVFEGEDLDLPPFLRKKKS